MFEISIYKIKFGSHKRQGIHGACPVDLFHALYLGTFKYTHDCLFEQIGKESTTAKQVNSLSQLYGDVLSHQSNCDLPVTWFANRLQTGKIMAQEYSRILLCMAAILQSMEGRQLLTKKKRNFGTNEAKHDWSFLVETLLQWDRWLRSTKMEKHHVQKAKKIHCYILYLLKKVVKHE